jgi:hypothetical protein
MFIESNASQGLPAIYWVEDGKLIKQVNYYTLNQTAIEKWLQQK